MIKAGREETRALAPVEGKFPTARQLQTAMRTGLLDLIGKGLTALRPEIGQLTNLRQLVLADNRLTVLPPEICQLTNLKSLWLYGNRLTVLPPEIGQLTNLNELWLRDNQLTALPPEIGQLTKLQVLLLEQNELTVLPPEIGQLSNLRILWLDGNQLTVLPPEIGQLSNLGTLHLGGNRLTALPLEIGHLTSLSELMLSRNELTVLPPEIGQLSDLTALSLDDNQLTALPHQLADFFAKEPGFSVCNNPLNEPFPELVERGTAALAVYLRSLDVAIAQPSARLVKGAQAAESLVRSAGQDDDAGRITAKTEPPTEPQLVQASKSNTSRIFLSYRHEETDWQAGWLAQTLVDHFGSGLIFKDIDSIEPGDDFVEVINNAVGSCDALLALIGKEWLTITNETGQRRLDNPQDFVRLEIEAALTRKVRVIPILVQGARMPRADQLPSSLAGLERRQALELSPSRFKSDADRLIKVLERTLTRKQVPPATTGF